MTAWFRPAVFPVLVFGSVMALSSAARADDGDIYSTYGAHNPPQFSPCDPKDCLPPRAPGAPSDPEWPAYWTTEWTMYRVFNKYEENPPPYNGKPPAALKPGEDYEASEGMTFYDSTWEGPNGQKGAMMEHYVKRCLPIFPLSNAYTCSFVSLGDTAYFLTYDEDRPSGMPPCCIFSPLNHPPARDFIKHLPFAAGDGARLDNRVQGYSFWVDHESGKPIQVGASPDRTKDDAILFGYGFYSEATPDTVDKTAAPYRHPQSFYFSGVPNVVPGGPNAPIVSQNFRNFSMTRPDPAITWMQVAQQCTGNIPTCQLFEPPPYSSPATQTNPIIASGPKATAATAAEASHVPTWGTIGQGARKAAAPK